SLSSAMESLCLKPKLTRKTKRKVKPSYNSVVVCITEDDFITEYKHNKGQKKKEKEKKQPKGGRKNKLVQDPPNQLLLLLRQLEPSQHLIWFLLEPRLEPSQHLLEPQLEPSQ
ncbi:MAG: hypothetical protein MJE68_11480, partial [Proteobacteria bacterium]|nr:hypothetical protein [Pseudomonadota bacterium]